VPTTVVVGVTVNTRAIQAAMEATPPGGKTLKAGVFVTAAIIHSGSIGTILLIVLVFDEQVN
jgi:hypothetical protein